MNDIEKRNEIPSTSALSKLGITAVGYSAAGIFLFILNIISRFRGLGFIAGGIVLVLGIMSIASKDPADKKAGLLMTAAGALTFLSKTGIPVVAAISGTLLSIGAIGLLGLGIWNGIKFFIGLKRRS
ncbi:MAG: hypothetical protein LBH16_11425 [Treponema sp.]|jgi:hypothetical protein|nr:hypothetical protein [Treponema sp.]